MFTAKARDCRPPLQHSPQRKSRRPRKEKSRASVEDCDLRGNFLPHGKPNTALLSNEKTIETVLNRKLVKWRINKWIMLKPGQTVFNASLRECPARLKFCSARAGRAKFIKPNSAAKRCALNGFFPQMATPEQRASMELLVRKGAPSEHFLYPLEITTAAGVPGFGYIMPLRPKRFKNIVDLMTRRIEPTFRALATAGFNLAHNYLLLHSQGLCYRDISFGNAFFDPTTATF
jgi:hypothetical protein